MSKLSVIAVSILIALLTKPWCKCGDPDSTDTKDEKSKLPTFAGEYAFVGSVELVTEDSRRCLCVATAITEKWLLTVYSCFSGIGTDDLSITVGQLDDASVKVNLPNFDLEEGDIGEAMKSINKVVVGPRIGEDGLVLLRVNPPISKELVSKVKVGSKDIEDGVKCVNVGWSPVHYPGADILGTDSKLKDVAQNVTRSLVNKTVPAKMKGHVIWGQTILTDKSADICKFETGSPLLCQDSAVWNLVGVAGSLGEPIAVNACSSRDDYAPYIPIKPYVDWMYTQMRKKDEDND